ncbi:SDR family oxidoreductase [Saccharothrix sp. NRRL B-16348]|uniref:SDR family oxidoreductase n=1 Tax=Saccharothrix sp. NRRL B-16348 TaxID=1415542 RepID=UPI0007C6D010|nr:SDR family oxidoreductase [Saccharothrix sp. NRRL B-16348]
MKVVVIGGTGLIGSKLVSRLGGHGHEVVAAAPDTGVDTLTGAGLADALTGADVVVDVSSTPFSGDAAELFETSTRNLLAAEAVARVGHHVALSVVGTGQSPQSGYFRARSAQEKLIENSGMPYSIVRATQFHEFLPRMADSATDDGAVRLAPVLFQPVAGDDVTEAVGRISAGAPVNGIVEVAGPEQFRMDRFFRDLLAARNDPRTVVTDPHASYFGTSLGERTLLPGPNAILGTTHYRDRPDRTGGGNPTGDHAFLHELELTVRAELAEAEAGRLDEAATGLPIEQWLSDPAETQLYEAGLRGLLGAVEAVEEDSRPRDKDLWNRHGRR